MVSISKKYKFIYIAAPKTASTSITECLEKFTDEPDFFHHATALETKAYLKEKGLDWTDFHSFSTVRNPWVRLVSMYNHIQKGCKAVTLWNAGIWSEQCKINFNQWLKKFGDIKECHYQYMCCDENKNCLIKQFIKVEELEIEFPKTMKKLGIKAELLKVNVKPHKPYQEYYNEETKQIVAETYKKEREMFGYKF